MAQYEIGKRTLTIRWSRPVKDKVPVSAVNVPAAHLKR